MTNQEVMDIIMSKDVSLMSVQERAMYSCIVRNIQILEDVKEILNNKTSASNAIVESLRSIIE